MLLETLVAAMATRCSRHLVHDDVPKLPMPSFNPTAAAVPYGNSFFLGGASSTPFYETKWLGAGGLGPRGFGILDVLRFPVANCQSVRLLPASRHLLDGRVLVILFELGPLAKILLISSGVITGKGLALFVAL